MQLDETASRSKFWRGGIPFVLADGQSWIVPRPRAQLADTPVLGNLAWTIEGQPDISIMADWNAGFVAKPGAEGGFYCVLLQRLLHLNYDLPERAVEWLTAVGYAEQARVGDAVKMLQDFEIRIFRPFAADVHQARKRAAVPVVDGRPVIGLN